MPHPLAATVQVLAFDIFGTVVDWQGSIVREIAALDPGVGGDAFARAWRAGYQPAMARVRAGWDAAPHARHAASSLARGGVAPASGRPGDGRGWALLDTLQARSLTTSCRASGWRI